MYLSAPHAGFARPVKIPARKSSLMQSSRFVAFYNDVAASFSVVARLSSARAVARRQFIQV